MLLLTTEILSSWCKCDWNRQFPCDSVTIKRFVYFKQQHRRVGGVRIFLQVKNADTAYILREEKKGLSTRGEELQEFFHLFLVVMKLLDFTFNSLLSGT